MNLPDLILDKIWLYDWKIKLQSLHQEYRSKIGMENNGSMIYDLYNLGPDPAPGEEAFNLFPQYAHLNRRPLSRDGAIGRIILQGVPHKYVYSSGLDCPTGYRNRRKNDPSVSYEISTSPRVKDPCNLRYNSVIRHML